MRLRFCLHSPQVPAKHAARLGQCFSTTVATVSVVEGADWVRGCADVERNGYCFSDGVGTMSPAMAQRVWSAFCEARKVIDEPPSFPDAFYDDANDASDAAADTTATTAGTGEQRPGRGTGAGAAAGVPGVPSAFQIRLGGCKGVLSLDVRLGGSVLRTRKSMDKFDARVSEGHTLPAPTSTHHPYPFTPYPLTPYPLAHTHTTPYAAGLQHRGGV